MHDSRILQRKHELWSPCHRVTTSFLRGAKEVNSAVHVIFLDSINKHTLQFPTMDTNTETASVHFADWLLIEMEPSL